MKPSQVEAWVISVADRVSKGGRVEDQRVEIKATFPEAARAARGIAGHANASSGEPVLWIVGLDEEEGVVGAPRVGMADWLKAVKSCFDGLAPDFTHLAVPYGGHELVAVVADTSRAPYVVRNPEFGKTITPISMEVPWREGTSTRSANREDLVRVLNPLAPVPELEWRRVRIEMQTGPTLPLNFSIQAWLYIVPRSDARLVLPFHRCAGHVRFMDLPDVAPLASLSMSPKIALSSGQIRNLSHTIVASDTEVIVSGPGEIHVVAQARLDRLLPDSVTSVELVMEWSPAFSDYSIKVSHDVPISPPGSTSSDHWEYIAPAIKSTA